MPGWHKRTAKYVEAGKLSVAGIVEEQHPDRALLYMQWQQMSWPVFADPFNDLGISVVPITLLIDEHGIIRYRNPKPQDLQSFINSRYTDDAKSQPVMLLPKSIDELTILIKDQPENARAHFRLGVAYRMRLDAGQSIATQSHDFANALDHWQKALDLNPDQYIWRRRIQQYGPRLDKPYSFYDWVVTARKEITARGELPTILSAEPSGSEFAVPRNSKDLKKQSEANEKYPDLANKITRDDANLVRSSVVVVPSTNKNKPALRVHLTLQPADATSWTNDAGNISFYLTNGSQARVMDLYIPSLPRTETSSEPRVVEFELHPLPGKSLPDNLTGSLFYYVCTKTDDTCLYLRKDVKIMVK